ncbi:MAG: T9SS type A sorting domain-containing protein [Bacteroidales bacterium]
MNFRKIIYLHILFFLTLSNLNAQVNMSWNWFRTAGVSNTQKATSIAVDNNNDVIVAGTFTANYISLGSNNIILNSFDSTGTSSNYFIAKYNQAGQAIWAKKALSASGISSNKVVTDNNGNIYASGYFSNANFINTVSFDGSSTYSHFNGKSFITKYSPQGITQWVVFVNNKNWGYDSITAMKWDQETNSLIFGGYFFGDTIGIGNISVTNSANYLHSSFIAKIGVQQGNVIWVKKTNGSSFINKVNDLCIDSSGAIYTAASFLGNYLVLPPYDTLINSNPSSGALINDGYFAKYDKNGLLQWSRKGVCNSFDELTTINCTNNNQLIIGGYNNSTFSINGIALNGSNLLLAYDFQGNYINATSFPATINSLNSFRNKNGFIIAGIFTSDSIVLGNLVLRKNSNSVITNTNVFMLRSDIFGTYAAGKAFGGSSSCILNGLTISDSNDVYVSGSFDYPSILFDTIQVNAHGNSDLYFAKLNAGFSLPVPVKYNLGGTVFAGLLPVDHAKVYLYDLNQTILDSCNIDTLGFYNFYQKPTGSYKLSARLLSNSIYFNQYNITTFYPDMINYSDAISISLTSNKWGKDIHLQHASKINEIYNKPQSLAILKLFPNPAKEELSLSLENGFIDKYKIEIYNTISQLIYAIDFKSSSFSEKIHLDVSFLKPGMYYLRLKDFNENIAVTRFVKIK